MEYYLRIIEETLTHIILSEEGLEPPDTECIKLKLNHTTSQPWIATVTHEDGRTYEVQSPTIATLPDEIEENYWNNLHVFICEKTKISKT